MSISIGERYAQESKDKLLLIIIQYETVARLLFSAPSGVGKALKMLIYFV